MIFSAILEEGFEERVEVVEIEVELSSELVA